MIRYPVLLQVVSWLVLAAGVVVLALGVDLLVQYKPEWLGPDRPSWGEGFFFAPIGTILVVTGWSLWRMRVRCDRSGIRYRSLFRTTLIPASEVKALVTRRGVSKNGVPYGVVDVIRQDGSEVRLDPTNSFFTASERIDAKLHALIQAMYESLGSVTPT